MLRDLVCPPALPQPYYTLFSNKTKRDTFVIAVVFVSRPNLLTLYIQFLICLLYLGLGSSRPSVSIDYPKALSFVRTFVLGFIGTRVLPSHSG